MAKRFTDNDIWKNQRWFRKLSPQDKLVFYYIKDVCHHSGIWQIDCSDLMDDLGLEDFSLPQFIANINIDFDKINGSKTFKQRLQIVQNNKLWVTGFIQFQYQNKQGFINPFSGPVNSALKYLENVGIYEESVAKKYIKLAPGRDWRETGRRLQGDSRETPPKKPGDWQESPPKIGGDSPEKPGDWQETVGRDKDKDKDKDNINIKVLKELNKEKIEKKFLIPKMLEIFVQKIPDYPGAKDKDFKPLENIAFFICGQSKLNGNHVENMGLVVKKWEQLTTTIAEDSFYSMKSLSVISNQIQEIYQIQKNGRNPAAKSSGHQPKTGFAHKTVVYGQP